MEFTIWERTVTADGLHLHTLKPIAESAIRGQILIIYGGTVWKNYARHVVKPFAEHLARAGFVTHFFDFRSNLPQHNFFDYGLFDRIEDTQKVIHFIFSEFVSLVPDQPPPRTLSLLGVSMGGHVAVELAAEFGGHIKNLFLVAPAAYHHIACLPEIKFGPMFKVLINHLGFDSNEWAKSQIFQRAKMVIARTFIVCYPNDKIVGEAPLLYRNALNCKMFVGPTAEHHGSFIQPERIKFLVEKIEENFF